MENTIVHRTIVHSPHYTIEMDSAFIHAPVAVLLKPTAKNAVDHSRRKHAAAEHLTLLLYMCKELLGFISSTVPP